MRVLVTGGAGYIGSHAARRLRQNKHSVVIYDNLSTGYRQLAAGFELIVGDVRDSDQLRSSLKGIDAVMHFAASAYVGESVSDPRKYFDNNVFGGMTLLNAALDAGVQLFVQSSTCATYGTPTRLPISEQEPQAPINPYGVSKLFLERALQGYSLAYGMRYVALRYFNAAGCDPSLEIGELHSPETHIIPLVCAAARGTIPYFEIYGDDYETTDGTCIRDYIHVCDLADAHVCALDYLARGGASLAVNLGTGQGHSVREVIDAVEAESKRRVPIRVSSRRIGDPPVLVADPSRAQHLFRWTAKRPFSEIVNSAWQWSEFVHSGKSPGITSRGGRMNFARVPAREDIGAS
ncbi:MAG: UDP-glucose 4-epimerase GalE [Terriglobales bacterium]